MKEKRLLSDFEEVEECYETFEVNDMSFMLSEHNIADALTKVRGKSISKETLYSVQLPHLPQQGTTRKQTCYF